MARCRCRWLFHGCVPTNTVIRDEREREAMEMEEFFRLAEIYSNCDTFDLKKKDFRAPSVAKRKIRKDGITLEHDS